MVKQQGYLMIEILISLVIFSIAIVSLVALQTNSYGSVQGSSSRNLAINAAYDLFDKMRSNKDAVINGTYLIGTPTDNSCKAMSFNTSHAAVNCTATQMAQDDLKEFMNVVQQTLPNGKAVICLDSAKSKGTPTSPNCDGLGQEYVIKIFWKNSSSKNLGTNSGYAQVIIGTQI